MGITCLHIDISWGNKKSYHYNQRGGTYKIRFPVVVVRDLCPGDGIHRMDGNTSGDNEYSSKPSRRLPHQNNWKSYYDTNR